MNPLLTAALAYAALGWRVVPLHNLNKEGACTCQSWRDETTQGPCGTPAKHPRFKGFREQASTDSQQIEKWWSQWPRANIGIITGGQSGILALDVDPRNNGDQSRDALFVKHSQPLVVLTTTARTGGGGVHYYFKWPAGLALDSFLELADGLEVIGEGHVLVAAPSYAHLKGKPYEWEPELGPDEQLPIDVPAWLLEVIRAKIQPSSVAKPGKAGETKFPPAEIGPILSGCAWMAHCSEHASSLSEPQWYAQLSILGRCKNGEELAHDLSSPHPGYTRSATSAKLTRALNASGPVTCSRVRHSLGGDRFCSECPSWGRIKSPIVLGTERRDQIPLPTDEPPLSVEREFSDSENPASASGAPPEDPPLSEAAQAVIDVIAGDDVEAAYRLARVLASESITEQAVFKCRLQEHFKKRLRIRDLERAIKVEKTKIRITITRSSLDWRSRLIRYQNSEPKAHLANAITAFRYAPEWKDVLWRNEFAECTVARKQPPMDVPIGSWTSHHDVAATNWLQHHGIDVGVPVVGAAIEAVGYDRTFHPVREYLNGLKWDGVPRLKNWLVQYLGATVARDAPANYMSYLEAVGSKWLISAVARVMRPGCKADCAIVLEGEQGIKKSSALGVLGGEWFTDQLEQLGSKDSSMQTHGIWIIEIGELGAMTKAEREEVKTFMSRRKERYRPPYAGRLVDIPRQCIFAGTVNPSTYFKDETGARRFWPVTLDVIKLGDLERDRDQIWAESKRQFEDRATWWLDEIGVIAVAEEEQADRYVEDPWDGSISRHIQYLDEVTIDEIFTECLKVELGRRTQADKNRIGAVLRFRGWKRFRVGSKKREYVFRPHTQAARLAGAQQVPLATEPLSDIWPEGRE